MKLASFVVCVCFVLTGILIGSGSHIVPVKTDLNESVDASLPKRKPRQTGHRSFLSPHASPIPFGMATFLWSTPRQTRST
jgi:hypothetical protein